MGLLDGILTGGRQAKSSFNDLIVNANRPQMNLPGMDLRMIRGGFGDALLNSDQPDPRLVQQQMFASQKAAAPANVALLFTLLSPFLSRIMPGIGSTPEYLRNKLGQYAGSESHKFIKFLD